MAGRFYGSQNFEPRFILNQILSLTACYYTGQALLLLIFDTVFGFEKDLSQIFSYTAYDLSDSYSFISFLSSIFNIPLFILAIVYIVERANKCLDFASTAYFINLSLVCLYDGFPWSFVWWILHACSLVSVVLISEYICMKIEQKEITINMQTFGKIP
jgi:hypothetical protein